MKEHIRPVSIMLFAMIAAVGFLNGCSFLGDEQDYDINGGYDTVEYVPPDYDFSITADADKISASVSNVGALGDNGHLVALPPYKYIYGETTSGISPNVNCPPIQIADYECGTAQLLQFDRYIDGNDALYYKYYIVGDNDQVLAGPMFCTEFNSIYTYPEPFKAASIKGVMCEDEYRDEVKDLGCSYTEINFTIDHIIVPNEIFHKDTGQIEPIIYDEETDSGGGTVIVRRGTNIREQVEKYVYNGKTYYFRRSSRNGAGLASFDLHIKKYTDDKVKVTIILLMHNLNDQYEQPYFLTYPATANAGPDRLVQVNTGNEYGANYWAAFMEFLAERYSRQNSPYGNVQTYILGNEIDAAGMWNSIVEPGHAALQLESYVEEVERELRISNFAVKKYYQDNTVMVSLTNGWSSAMEYSPKDVLDYLTLKTLREGNYNYGFALHPYGAALNTAAFWNRDHLSSGMTGALSTSKITWSNLEVMQLYLEQTTKLFNGKVRTVFLTEGGVTSESEGNGNSNSLTRSQQAAGVAYAYYKSVQLSCVKALIYYRLTDVPEEGAYFGLMTADHVKKESYQVYKYIDTQYYEQISAPYLEYIEWSVTEGSQIITYGVHFHNIFSWQDTMCLFKSRFDWSTHWDTNKIGVRIIKQEDYDG